ncbi:MAG TPA: PRC-barrel domain-containing protein [Thioalkalivibrio sp.]|nr:PRC-barrel domain-containing protein [Thioalkalivibrio sp.]
MQVELQDTRGNTGDRPPDGAGAQLLSASSMIGNEVWNRNQQRLGEVKELMLNTVTGGVSYAVVSAGGFLGMGDTLHAVPWSILSLDREGHRFVLDIDAERFKDAPGFDKETWPQAADVSWSNRVNAFYGMQGERVGTVDPTSLHEKF